jgi:hypothetical protein
LAVVTTRTDLIALGWPEQDIMAITLGRLLPLFRFARFFVECGRRLFGALAFLFCDELPQFLGVADHRAGVGVFGDPTARVFAKLVNIVIGFTRQFVLDPPDFFEDRIRFHGSLSSKFNGGANLGQGESARCHDCSELLLQVWVGEMPTVPGQQEINSCERGHRNMDGIGSRLGRE